MVQGSSVARECILDILDIEQGVIMVTPYWPIPDFAQMAYLTLQAVRGLETL